jgi:hypothetical protein
MIEGIFHLRNYTREDRLPPRAVYPVRLRLTSQRQAVPRSIGEMVHAGIQGTMHRTRPGDFFPKLATSCPFRCSAAILAFFSAAFFYETRVLKSPRKHKSPRALHPRKNMRASKPARSATRKSSFTIRKRRWRTPAGRSRAM